MRTKPATRRKPSGAAVAGAYPRPINYPCQLVIMVSEQMRDQIESAAKEEGVSKSVIARTYIGKGMLYEAIGH